MPKSLFPPAVGAGVLACLVIAVPAVVIQAVLRNDGNQQSNWVFLTLLAIVAAYLIGGAVAGWVAGDTPMINGAAATTFAFAAVQTVAAVFRIVGGDGINPLALVFNALLAAAIGTVGGGIGAYLANRARVNR